MRNTVYLFSLIFIFIMGCEETPKNETSEPEEPAKREMSDALNSGFKATGNEPFWSIEIDFNKKMHFKSIGDPEFEVTMSTPDPITPQGTSEITYLADADGDNLQVTIKRDKCQDNMSGQNFSHTVSVTAKSKSMDAPKIFTGCGNYTGDYRLNDIWALRELDGETIDRKVFRNGVPTLEIQITAQKVFGNAGCNEFNGSLTFMERKNKLKMGPLASTKMACPQMETESKYLEALSSGALEYTFQDLYLTLKNKDHTLLYQKVD